MKDDKHDVETCPFNHYNKCKLNFYKGYGDDGEEDPLCVGKEICGIKNY